MTSSTPKFFDFYSLIDSSFCYQVTNFLFYWQSVLKISITLITVCTHCEIDFLDEVNQRAEISIYSFVISRKTICGELMNTLYSGCCAQPSFNSWLAIISWATTDVDLIAWQKHEFYDTFRREYHSEGNRKEKKRKGETDTMYYARSTAFRSFN